MAAQEPVYSNVLDELSRGRKETDWMCFIFPQIAGLDDSQMAQQFAISDLSEAQAYLEHPVLGQRLRECTAILTNLRVPTITDVFGEPDTEKFHASLSLFFMAARTREERKLFGTCLKTHFSSDPHWPSINEITNPE